MYDMVEQASVEVIEIDDFRSPSVTPPPPSQPHIFAKPSTTTAKPLKSDVSLYYERYSPDDEAIDKSNEDRYQDAQLGPPVRGNKRPSLSQVCV